MGVSANIRAAPCVFEFSAFPQHFQRLKLLQFPPQLLIGQLVSFRACLQFLRFCDSDIPFFYADLFSVLSHLQTVIGPVVFLLKQKKSAKAIKTLASFFVFTLERNTNGKAALEKVDVRPMSIWWRRGSTAYYHGNGQTGYVRCGAVDGEDIHRSDRACFFAICL